MANIKSSKQDIIKSRERHKRNQARKGQMRGSIRRARTAIQAGGDEAVTALRTAISMIDRASSRGSIHPNAAARRKSRLAQKLNDSQAVSS
ncbi:MAG: 30S ribosomal protein S20 [Armatimonadota bacterium]|nr:30S ribosomal protein S20 [Armatimonadota bacterium]